MNWFTAFRTVFTREIRTILNTRLIFTLTIVLPLVSFALFAAMFIRGSVRDLPIAVMDEDSSSLSRKITSSLDALPSINVAESASSLYEGRKLIEQGRVFALIYLQKNLHAKMLRGESPGVVCFYSNQNQVAGGTMLKDITGTIRAISGGILADSFTMAGVPSDAVRALVEPVRVDTHTLFNPFMSYLYYLASSLMPTMLQFFILICSIYSLGCELKMGTGAEVYSAAGERISAVIAGKLFPYTVIFVTLGMFMLALFFSFLKFPLKGSPALIAGATVLLVIAYQSVAVFYVSISGKLIMALLSASFYASTAFTFIGMTFPYISMYWPAQLWANLLPLYHYTKIYMDSALKGLPINYTAASFMALFAFILLPLLTAPRLRRLYRESSFPECRGGLS